MVPATKKKKNVATWAFLIIDKTGVIQDQKLIKIQLIIADINSVKFNIIEFRTLISIDICLISD